MRLFEINGLNLDFAGYIDWLSEYLPRCTYIIISHDISFLNSTCSRIVEIAKDMEELFD